VSGATFDFLPTHELFGFRYTIFFFSFKSALYFDFSLKVDCLALP